MLLEGFKGLGNLVPQGHPVVLPLAVGAQPACPGPLLPPVCLDLLFAAGVPGVGVGLGGRKPLDLLQLLLAAARRGPG